MHNSNSHSSKLDDNISTKEFCITNNRKSEKEESSKMYGPLLPPAVSNTNIQESDDISFGPALPQHLGNRSDIQNQNIVTKSSSIEPSFPPFVKQSDDSNQTLGSALPPHLKKQSKEEGSLGKQAREIIDHEDDVYGPMPAEFSSNSAAHAALEERALQIKLDLLAPSKDKTNVREEWMTELPEVKAANLGFGARQFRARAGPDLSDRSSWTDTPEKKAKKMTGKKEIKTDIKEEAKKTELQKRDRELEKIARKLKKKKKRDKSLLEMHQTKLKSEKKEESIGGRRPFSRDIDLKVNNFDEAQKRSILKKAQPLDDRFSRGQSKFL